VGESNIRTGFLGSPLPLPWNDHPKDGPVMDHLQLTDELSRRLRTPRGPSIHVPVGLGRDRSVHLGLPPIVIRYQGADLENGDAKLVIDAPRRLRVVRGELLLSRESGWPRKTAPREPGQQRAGNLDKNLSINLFSQRKNQKCRDFQDCPICFWIGSNRPSSIRAVSDRADQKSAQRRTI
jgi:hypothetical protein